MLGEKSLLTMLSNVLHLHLKQTFLPIIWIFTEDEGDGIESRLPFKIFSTLTTSCHQKGKWISFVSIKHLFSSTHSGSVNRNVIKHFFSFDRMYSESNQIRAPTTIIPSLFLKEQKTLKSQVLGGPRSPYQHSQKLENSFVNNK